MELRTLRYFLLAAREENMTRAAELLHVTQPTLSRQLMQLEQELGTKLFHRGQHSISLTDDGMLLKRRAQELVELADKTERKICWYSTIFTVPPPMRLRTVLKRASWTWDCWWSRWISPNMSLSECPSRI